MFQNSRPRSLQKEILMDARVNEPEVKDISQRIAEAKNSRTQVTQPDPDAPVTAPEGTELAKGKAPMAVRHLFCLLHTLKGEHESVAQAHKDAEGTAGETKAGLAHLQNHQDASAVKSALMKALQEAYPDEDDEFSAFVILKDWSVARRRTTSEDKSFERLTESLADLLGGRKPSASGRAEQPDFEAFMSDMIGGGKFGVPDGLVEALEELFGDDEDDSPDDLAEALGLSPKKKTKRTKITVKIKVNIKL